jgi:nucleotide-binding universal stress UspA family protein
VTDGQFSVTIPAFTQTSLGNGTHLLTAVYLGNDGLAPKGSLVFREVIQGRDRVADQHDQRAFVPRRARFRAGKRDEECRMTHVLLATDGSAGARAAVRFTAGLLKSIDVNDITVLVVVQPYRSAVLDAAEIPVPQIAWDELANAADAAATRVLDDAVSELSAFAGRIATMRRTGSPVQQIVAVAREVGADLVVVGTHGWSALRALFRPSVAQRLMRRTECPVLVIRASQVKQTGRRRPSDRLP